MLRAMGGDLTYENQRTVGGEPVADIRVRHSQLHGIEVPPELAPSMIDEFPILFVAAALAKGRTVTRGLEELRVKESDRLALMAQGLARLGIAVDESADGLVIDGRDGDPFATNAPVTIAAELDHRIAMSFAIAGLASRGGVEIDDMAPVATSFPGFTAMLGGLGAETMDDRA
jgi:3-phosphoshikimate 1-carboxyvinyltransferase